MEIILLEKIRNLGDLGETVKVANGYARNFLIPRKKAMRATEEAKAEVEERRRQLAMEESQRQEVAQARADLAIREITVTRLAGEGGGLYGSVSPADIAEALAEAGTQIEKAEIFQPDGPIKQIGEFEAEVILHPEVRFGLKITVQEGQSNAASAVEAAAGDDAGAESEAVPDLPDADAKAEADTATATATDTPDADAETDLPKAPQGGE